MINFQNVRQERHPASVIVPVRLAKQGSTGSCGEAASSAFCRRLFVLLLLLMLEVNGDLAQEERCLGVRPMKI